MPAAGWNWPRRWTGLTGRGKTKGQAQDLPLLDHLPFPMVEKSDDYPAKTLSITAG